MKLLIWSLLFCQFIFSQTNPSHVQVKGYTRSDGTYVAPHVRTAPNSTNSDNFSTIGNTNPYTGEAGYIPSDGGTTTYRNYNNTTTTTTAPNYTYPSSNYPSSTNTYSTTPHRGNLTPIRTTTNYDYVDVYEENRLLKERIVELENEINEQKEAIQFMQEDYHNSIDSTIVTDNMVEIVDAEPVAQNSESYTPARDSISLTPDYPSEDSESGNSAWPIIIFVCVFVLILYLARK